MRVVVGANFVHVKFNLETTDRHRLIINNVYT